jgi:hypothetical protein
MTGLRIVAWKRHWSFNLVKDFGAALGEPYATMQVGTLARKFIARPGVLRLRGNELWVTLTPFTRCQALANWIQQPNQQWLQIPWLDHLILQMEIAPLPVGPAANRRAVRRRVLANGKLPMVTNGNRCVRSVASICDRYLRYIKKATVSPDMAAWFLRSG